MGKKRIVQQSTEEIIKEKEALESALKKAQIGSSVGVKKTLRKIRIYIRVSYNNTIITVTDEKGNVITWCSSGSLGFKGPKKATPFAAARVAEAIMERLKKSEPEEVEIYVSGIGGGRESAIRAFVAKGLNITLVKDITPIPHNGPKPPKPRRV
jgi:small subunit ribosomal protein S11